MNFLNKIIYLFICITLLVFFKSCAFSGSQVIGYFFLISRTEAGNKTPMIIDAGADIEKVDPIKKQGIKTYGGILKIDDRSFGFDSSKLNSKVNFSALFMAKLEMRTTNSGFAHSYNLRIHPSETEKFFGRNVIWSLSGDKTNGISQLRDSVYTPSVLTLDVPSGKVINKADFTITWNADTANNKGINISIYYLGAGRQGRKIIADKTNLVWQSSSPVKDNGMFTLERVDADKFPENGYILISIERRNDKTIKKGLNQQFYIMTASYSSGVFELESGRLAEK